MWISACQSAQEKEVIQEIDNQLTYIDNIIEQYKALPIDSLNHAYQKKLKPHADKIKTELDVNFKLTNEEMNILSDYADYIKGLRKVVPLAEKTAQGLFVCKKQLTDLRKDIIHGAIPADSLKIYLENELFNLSLMHVDIIKVLELKTIGDVYRITEQKADTVINRIFKKK
jgi:hypothetical protein